MHLRLESDDQWGIKFESFAAASHDARLESSLGHIFAARKRIRLQFTCTGARLYGGMKSSDDEGNSPTSAGEEDVIWALPDLSIDIDALLTR